MLPTWLPSKSGAAHRRSSQAAKSAAVEKLRGLGGIGRQEGIVLGAMGVTIALWVSAATLKLSVVAAALVGLMILLVTKVLTWDDCAGNKSAWTIFTWFSAVIAMAQQLKAQGLVDVFSNNVAAWLQAMTLPWQASFVALVLLYFYSHYLFASNASHVSAMFAGFLSIAMAVGVPPVLAALVLAFLSNVQGVISSYGMSHAPLYFGKGYVPLGRWMYQALAVSVVNLVVWLCVGGAWWKVLGYW